MIPIQFTLPVYGEGIFALLEDRKANFYEYYHRHEELQITCVIKGSGTIMVGNLIRSFQEGDVFLLTPNEPHMLEKWSDGRDVVSDIHAIHLFVNMEKLKKLSIIPELEQVVAFMANLDSSKKLEPNLSEEIRPYFFRLVEKINVAKFIEFLQLLHLLSANVGAMTSIYSGVRHIGYTDKSGERLSTVCRFTFEQYHRPIAISEVAALIYMTSSAFCKFFKKHTMKTYVSFLQEVRIEKACQLMVNDRTENIAQIAFRVGFNNVVHFNRVFKQVTGVSPRQYVERHSL